MYSRRWLNKICNGLALGLFILFFINGLPAVANSNENNRLFPELAERIKQENEKFLDTGKLPILVKEEVFELNYPMDKSSPAKSEKRQVRFQFDVYRGKGYGGVFLKAGEWHDFSEAENERESFFLPSWVEEREKYSIQFRKVNSSGNIMELSPINISVRGTIRMSRILRISDAQKRYLLSYPIYPDIKDREKKGVPLGSWIDGVISTNGDLWNRGDGIVINPSYYYVDRQGNRQEADIYRKVGKYLRKINVKNKAAIQTANLSNYLLEAEEEWFGDTAKVLTEQKRNLTFTTEDYSRLLKEDREIYIGDTSLLYFGDRLKLYSGRQLLNQIVKPREVSEEDIVRSRQNWYYRFYLPKEIYAVAKGTDLQREIKDSGKRMDEELFRQAPFLNNGYLLVSFEIQVIKNGQTYLAYKVEPRSLPSINYKPNDGDILLYDLP